MSEGLYVQYGCGFSAPEGWLNFDASPTLRFERLPLIGNLYTRNRQRFPNSVRYGNVVKGLPVPSSSCDGVYASHVLEHLALDDFHAALVETARVLRPGGLFRLVVPDMEALARQYLDRLERRDPEAGHALIRGAHLGAQVRPRSLGGFVREWLGNSRHLWMWDFLSLEAALRRHGFVDIRRAEFNDSTDSMFQIVEDVGRFEGACAVEARRPDQAAVPIRTAAA